MAELAGGAYLRLARVGPGIASGFIDVIESCLEEAVRLSHLIGDLLFLERAEAPSAHLGCKPVDVSEVLARVRDSYKTSALESQVSLSTADDSYPVIAELDRTLLQRAVGNLVSNALAYTPPGGVVLLSARADPSMVRIEVSDTGSGIRAEALPRVFDRLFRVDSSRSHDSGGTGWPWPSSKPSPCCTAVPWRS